MTTQENKSDVIVTAAKKTSGGRRLKISLADKYNVKALHYTANNKFEKLSAHEMLEIFDYKKQGMKIADANEYLATIRRDIARIRTTKTSQFKFTPRIQELKKRLEQKRRAADAFQKELKSAHPVADINLRRYGVRKHAFGTRLDRFISYRISEDTYCTVKWDESHDWSYYSKSYGHPKSSYYNRRVEFYTLTSTKEITTKIVQLDSFAGNFLFNAIAEFFGIAFSKSKFKNLQIGKYSTVSLVRRIFGTEFYKITIKDTVISYAAQHDNIAAHGASFKECLESIRLKKKQADADMEAVYTASELNKEKGFCWEMMREFCDINGFDINKRYSVRDIKIAAAENRKRNRKYKSELLLIGAW